MEQFSEGALHGERAAGWSGLAVAGLPWHVREGESERGWSCVKRSHTRCVLRGEWTPEGAAAPVVVYAKRYRLRNWRKVLLALVHQPKGPREFALLTAMKGRGIPAPRPLLWAVERRGSWPRTSYLLTETLGEDGLPLKQFFVAQNAAERLRLTCAAMRFLRAAHDQGFYHDDCSADHMYLDVPAWLAGAEDVTTGGAADHLHGLFAFLDVDNARIMERGAGSNGAGAAGVSESLRLKNIVQLWRSFGKREDYLTREMKQAGWVEYWGGAAGRDDKRLRERLNRIARRKLGREIL